MKKLKKMQEIRRCFSCSDFGIVLGCRFYVKAITNRRLAEKEPGLRAGDVVTRINDADCDALTLAEARRLLDRSRERLSLVVQRNVPRGQACKWSSQSTLYERLGSGDVSNYRINHLVFSSVLVALWLLP